MRDVRGSWSWSRVAVGVLATWLGACEDARRPIGPPATARDGGPAADGGPSPGDAAGLDAAVIGASCTSERDCPGSLCDRLTGRCVACRSSNDCSGQQRCDNARCVATTGCQGDLDCTGMGMVCDQVGRRCVACNSAADCTNAACIGHSCYATRGCTSSLECADLRSVCGPAPAPNYPAEFGGMACVDCASTADCAPRHACAAGRCVDACVGRSCGDSMGVSCGSCGDRQMCSEGSCVDACGSRVCGSAMGVACGTCASGMCLESGNACASQLPRSFIGQPAGLADAGDRLLVFSDGRQSGAGRLVSFHKATGDVAVIGQAPSGHYLDAAAANSTTIFFATTDGGVFARPRSGGVAMRIATVVDACWEIAADESFVYCALRNFSAPSNDGLYRIPVGGGAPEAIDLVGVALPDSLIVRADRVYWHLFNDGLVGYTELSTRRRVVLKRAQVDELVLAGDELFFSIEGSVRSIEVSTGAERAEDGRFRRPLAGDASRVYFSGQDGDIWLRDPSGSTELGAVSASLLGAVLDGGDLLLVGFDGLITRVTR